MMVRASKISRWVLMSCVATLLLTASVTWSAPPKVGQRAPDFELPDLAGAKTKLSSLLADGPVVLVVLRGNPGYQCPLCSRQFGDFVTKSATFEKSKARVVFIYPGPSDGLKAHAEQFVAGRDYPEHFAILLDADYTFTNAYGLRWEARNETAYPSTFVLDAAGKIVFAKISKQHGGRSAAAEVVKALPTP